MDPRTESKSWKKDAADPVIAEHFGEHMVSRVQMTLALLECFQDVPRRRILAVHDDEAGRMLVDVIGRPVDVQSANGSCTSRRRVGQSASKRVGSMKPGNLGNRGKVQR